VTAQLSPCPIFKSWRNDGTPNAGGSVYTYFASTTTPAATWTDYTQAVQNTNPIILDARGEANIWLNQSLFYKFIQYDSNGTLLKVTDNISVINSTITSVTQFGAIGDGVTDNSAAINAAYAAMPTRGALYFPAGTYIYTSALTFAGQKRPAFIGDGATESRLIYAGANTTNDCITIGNGSNGEVGWNIQGIGFYSNTVMTGGAGLHAQGLQRSRLEDVHVGDQDSNSNFYIGAWLDGLDLVAWDGIQCRGSLEALRVNGQTALGLADLFISNGKIPSSGIGIHVAGSFGGLNIDLVDIINNGTNCLIDKAVTGTSNREIAFGPNMALDSACTSHDAATFDGINVDIQDTGGTIFFKGTWCASASTGIRMGANFTGLVVYQGGYLFNMFNTFGGDGNAVNIGNAGATFVTLGTYFRHCQGAGVNPTVPTVNVILINPHFASDVVNPVNSNIGATTQTTYLSDHLSALGKMAVGSQSVIATGVNAAPQFTIAGNAGGLQAWSNSVGNPWWVIGHSRGTTPGTHTTLQVGDQLGGVSLEGSDGTAFRLGAEILSTCIAAPASNQITANLVFKVNPGTGITTAKTLSEVGDLSNVAGSTGMTGGFIWIPSGAGAPSGTPASISGNVPLYYDRTNNFLYVYNGGWKKSTVYA